MVPGFIVAPSYSAQFCHSSRNRLNQSFVYLLWIPLFALFAVLVAGKLHTALGAVVMLVVYVLGIIELRRSAMARATEARWKEIQRGYPSIVIVLQ